MSAARLLMTALSLAGGSAMLSPARAESCALGAAAYASAEGDTATLRFGPGAKGAESAFGFVMTLGPKTAYRFRLAAASGAGETYAELVAEKPKRTAGATTTPGRVGARTEAEEQDDDTPASPIHFFDERFRRAEPESLTDAAPAAVFLPELQRAFVYWTANPDPDTAPPAGMWVRECGR